MFCQGKQTHGINMFVAESICNERIKLQSTFTASYNMQMGGGQVYLYERYAFSDHICSRESPNVVFRISAGSEDVGYEDRECSARLFMVNPTPKDSVWTITWSAQIVDQNGQINGNFFGKMICNI